MGMKFIYATKLLKNGANSLTRKDIENIQMKALEDIWGEWEDYLND